MNVLGINDLDLLQELFERLDRSPFYVKDRTLQYRACNPAMAQLCGAGSCRAMIGKSAGDYFPMADAARFEALELSVIESGQPLKTIIDFVEGKEPEWLIYSHLPLFDRDGSVVGVAGTSVALSRRKMQAKVYRRVLAASEFLRLKLAEPLDILATGRAAGASAAQVQRDFRRTFGLTPRQFLMALRMTEARRLLLGEQKIAEIAFDVGFADQSAFTRRFRTTFGLSPTDFRRNMVRR